VKYQLAAAEASGIEPASIDLITVAQALHWFRLDEFWSEARRVLRPNGFIAVWCYAFLNIDPKIDSIVNHFYSDIVGPYWDFERRLVEDGYRSINFPFPEFQPPPFAIETAFSLPHLLGYLQSWSATQNFIKANGSNPVEIISDELTRAWSDPAIVRTVKWPLSLRVGKNTPLENR
jgi:SAM-dependent methyltransferase